MIRETRVPCPVCLGVKMEKVVLEDALVLDHCMRCGGVWFDAGEVQALRRCEAELLWREIVRRDEPHAMLCHSCRSPVARAEAACSVCGWRVELDCPTCARPLELSSQGDLQLDFCRRCRGVWFDHVELAGIWRTELNAAVTRRRASRVAQGAGDASGGLLEVLMFDPFLMYYGLSAGAHVAGAAVEGVAGAAAGSGAALGEMAEAAGEAAGGVFETLVEIISGIFG